MTIRQKGDHFSLFASSKLPSSLASCQNRAVFKYVI